LNYWIKNQCNIKCVCMLYISIIFMDTLFLILDMNMILFIQNNFITVIWKCDILTLLQNLMLIYPCSLPETGTKYAAVDATWPTLHDEARSVSLLHARMRLLCAVQRTAIELQPARQVQQNKFNRLDSWIMSELFTLLFSPITFYFYST
jgi:hypothetical protein